MKVATRRLLEEQIAAVVVPGRCEKNDAMWHAPHMDKVFAVRQVCEKYLANGKDVFWAFMDLEKAYDTIDRDGMWQMIRLYGVGRK